MKYRYVITNEGIVEAGSLAEAQAAAFVSLDHAFGVFACEVEPVEPLTKGEGENG